MSLWSRITNVFRGERLSRDIDEELASHLDEALLDGRDEAEVRSVFGSSLRRREESRDVLLIPWLESLRADAIFGWRQIRKRKVTSVAAILSLAVSIGVCTSAFRLIDALLLRPLPIADAQRLYALSYEGMGYDGKPFQNDSFSYPMFQQMRAAGGNQAELLAVSYAQRQDLTYGSDQDVERAYVQYVSGWMFSSFGLRPALGRLLTERDDLNPGGHPLAVISHDYWARRFGADAHVIGQTVRIGSNVLEIIGVLDGAFTGTEPGTMTDIFLPTMMSPAVGQANANWLRTLVRLKPGIQTGPLRDKLQAVFRVVREEQVKGFTGMPKQTQDRLISQKLLLVPAAAGASGLQSDYRLSLVALSILAALVLLIACANVANLMTVQASSRAREMALRVSIGAGRVRLVQLVLVESALLALLSALLGGLFAWRSAPFVLAMVNPVDNPVRLVLPADWRVLGFVLALTFLVLLLFGLLPALRASAVKPSRALKGGGDPHSRRHLVNVLVAVQTTFCFLVLFIAGMFVATFERLSNQTTGFSADGVLTLDIIAQRNEPPAIWDQMIEHVRSVPGVAAAALAEWPLLSGNARTGFVSINTGPAGQDPVWLLDVSPGWIGTMKIPFIDGRDFRASESYPSAAIVNDAFAKRYFEGQNPTGKSFDTVDRRGGRIRFEIVGFVRDARYFDMRGPIAPTAYFPFRSLRADGIPGTRNSGTLVIQTASSNPLALASILRREVPRARSELRVSNIRTQEEIDHSQTTRERLLATLALFFAVIALLLGGIGLYAVLNHSVYQRRREIGIRMAIGARAGDIVRRVTQEAVCVVLVGAMAGLAIGLASVRYIETLLYQVKATDIGTLVIPSVALLIAALLAALPAVIHAVRIDPIKVLRTE
jgi:predicted permease